jgi:hypothetical protein
MPKAKTINPRRAAPNVYGLDYNGPFYRGKHKEERRAMVLTYLPHKFADTHNIHNFCRICGFPMADAPCISNPE